MSRRIKNDFEKLIRFFGSYSIDPNIKNTEFQTFLSTYHKRYFAYLTFIAELSQYQSKALLSGLNDSQYRFYAESCSDCGLALFDSVNGNYKGSRLLQRSSIENFMKAISLNEDTTIDQEKSVYTLFDRAKAISFFSNETTKNLFDIIHLQYKELCKDVHTATIKNMVQLSALNTLPAFNVAQAKNVAVVVQRLISAYVTLLALKYNAFYHTIHYENKDVIQTTLIKEYANIINNI